MRGLQRLRGPASCLSTCTATAPRTTPFFRQLSTSTNGPLRFPRPTHKTTVQLQRRNNSTVTTTTSPTDAEVADDPFMALETAADPAHTPVETELVLPYQQTQALLPETVTDPTYVPATSAEGLEEVGGLDGWWDKPGHWYSSKIYHGFGPREMVTDRAMLEVFTRQALVEAIVLSHRKNATLPGPEERQAVVLSEIIAGPDGEATLNTEAVSKVVGLGKPKVGESAPAAEQQVAEGEELAVADGAEVQPFGSHELTPTEARQLTKMWDSSWKTLKMEDPVLKFWFGRRITELTGHRILDFKLMSLSTPASIINHLVQPAKPRKLVEEIEEKGLLAELLNVKVFPKRVGPVDKEKMVGRWKIIEKELKARGLPVLGTGGYEKTPETRWLRGDV